MARSVSLDRKAKRAITALLLVLLAIIALVVWKSVVALTPDTLLADPTAQTEDELIQIGSHALLLEHGSAANRIAHWLHAGSKNSKAFELGNRSFAGRTDAFTAEGEQRIEAIAEMMTHVRSLHAELFLSNGDIDRQLEEMRELQIRGALIAEGVSPSRIDVSDDPIAGGAGMAKEPEVVVVLTT